MYRNVGEKWSATARMAAARLAVSIGSRGVLGGWEDIAAVEGRLGWDVRLLVGRWAGEGRWWVGRWCCLTVWELLRMERHLKGLGRGAKYDDD